MLAGIAVFDFDNDGWPDIFIANGATVPELKKVSPNTATAYFETTTMRHSRTSRRRQASPEKATQWASPPPISITTVSPIFM